MSAPVDSQRESGAPEAVRNWKWVRLGAVLCLGAWLALGAGLVMDAGKGTLLALTTIAALATEGLIWLTALTLGVSVFKARRYLWARLRGRSL